MSCAVLFQQFPLDELGKVAAAVSAVCGIAVFDATAKVRRGWGFLQQGLSEADAQRLVEALAGRGVAAVVVTDAALLAVPEPEVMTGFAADAEGLRPVLQSPTADTALVPWSKIAIVAAAGFSEEVIRRDSSGKTGASAAASMVRLGVFLATGIPIGLLGRKQEAPAPRKVAQTVIFAQIVTATGRSFFINSDHFDFSGLGSQKQLNASLNFRTLITELARRTPARLNHGARLVLEKKSLTLANYQSLEDLETELEWLLNSR